ncbi:TadE/TadG family type IV pilus assembly protein [Fodinicola feengrottensis]|uniref:TadE-like domain-containing protein n=1 Tax=Fodinicola feengrottensis TaxID=435914 RepID=A0ABN2FS81_9ACTN|nr:TadE/TadG family type IV pilus assembly protein [Fodinicola feengrottensis]
MPPPTWAGRGLSSEEGSIVVQWAIVVPLALLVAIGIVQVGLYQRGQQIADVTASHALVAARLLGGTPADGIAAGNAAATQIGGGSVRDVRVTITQNADTVNVTVQARVLALLPGPLAIVRAQAVGPRERYVAASPTLQIAH